MQRFLLLVLDTNVSIRLIQHVLWIVYYLSEYPNIKSPPIYNFSDAIHEAAHPLDFSI